MANIEMNQSILIPFFFVVIVLFFYKKVGGTCPITSTSLGGLRSNLKGISDAV